MIELTQDYIRSFLHYDPETGVMRRIKKRTWTGNIVDCNVVPTSTTSCGYLQINIDKKPSMVHRLAFLYMLGEFPPVDVDHINGDRLDNRWINLRAVTRQDNLRNMGIKSTNTSGCTGVSFAKDRNSWHAYIGVGGGCRVSLGHFASKEEAVNARAEAERSMSYHANHGKRASWER